MHIKLIQSIPKYSMTEIIRMIKSITAKKIFEKHPEVKSNYGVKNFGQMVFVNIVSKFGSEDTISKYARNQGIEKEYKKLHYQKLVYFRENRYPLALLWRRFNEKNTFGVQCV